MRAAIEARDELLSCLSRNPQAFARAEKPETQTDVLVASEREWNLTTPLNNGYWGTIFKTALGDYKYVTRNDFSARSFATEDAAREAAEERWGPHEGTQDIETARVSAPAAREGAVRSLPEPAWRIGSSYCGSHRQANAWRKRQRGMLTSGRRA